MTDERDSFERDVTVDDPGIIGARWWNRALGDERAAVTRRDAMKSAAWVAGVGVLSVGGACIAGVVAAVASDDTETRNEPSLDAQRRFGWNLGARDQHLGFLIETMNEPFDTAALARDLTPVTWRHVYTPTLLDAPDAMPRENPSEERVPFVPLRAELKAGLTATARPALDAGIALARIFANRDAKTALVLDLVGSASVAFAAGAARVFEPVLAIGNWPHPRGVVASHLTLATALKCHYYFHQARAQRPAGAPPCFVLDRNRLSESVEADRFDNRFLASLPSAATLRAGGIERVLYVVPGDYDHPELDDLNDDFLAWMREGIEVRGLSLRAFLPGSDGTVYYGGSPEVEAGFWLRYPWSAPAPTAQRPWIDNALANYRPVARATRFSRRSVPAGFATVGLVVSGAVVLGAAFDRRGSWNRTSGGAWSGG